MSDARLFLASRRLPGLRAWLAAHAPRGPAVLVPTAANPLPDRAAVVGELRGLLEGAQLAVDELDVEATPSAADTLAGAGVIIVGGGDPYHLLATLRGTGADAAVCAAVRAGALYVGVSAGAIVAGPSLEPHTLVSPFAPPPGLPLDGLGLCDAVIVPHRERAGRAERIAEARRRLGDRFDLYPLGDDEVCLRAVR